MFPPENAASDNSGARYPPYCPDWAVLIEQDDADRLYFVVETKGSLFTDDLRDKESAKIRCGEAHFATLSIGVNSARFVKATQIDDLMAEL